MTTTTTWPAPWADHGHFVSGDLVVFIDPWGTISSASVTRIDHAARPGLDECLVVGNPRHGYRHAIGCPPCTATLHPERTATAPPATRAALTTLIAAIACVIVATLFLTNRGPRS